MTETSEQEFKVGDTLAFRNPQAVGVKRWVQKIEKITPSGLIKCGSTTLNPDLSIRGQSTWSTMHCIGRPTPEFIAAAKRERAIAYLYGVDWNKLETDTLEAAIAVIQQEG